MSVKVIIPSCRLSYPALFQPRKSQEGDKETYQATILVPKTNVALIQAIQTAIQQEMVEASKPEGKWKGAQPPNPLLPFYDGDNSVQPRSGKPWGDECKGHWVLRTSSTTQPDIVDENGDKVLQAVKFYAGCYCHYSVNIAAYNNKQLGIGAYLNCVGFAKDGEPLEAHASAKEDFADLLAARTTQPPMSQMPQMGQVGQMPSAMPQMPNAVPPMGQMPQTAAPTGFGGFGGFGGFPQQ